MTLYHIGYVRCRKMLVQLGTNNVTCDYKIDWYLTSIIVWPKLGFMTWVICTSFSNMVAVVGITSWWTFITPSTRRSFIIRNPSFCN
jgi:hypothetical protein